LKGRLLPKKARFLIYNDNPQATAMPPNLSVEQMKGMLYLLSKMIIRRKKWMKYLEMIKNNYNI